ncbi:glycosyltransferase [Hymenobacter sp. BT683]|uniref:Glycosyltransferase n=1 Tax=Hymenobacter jeongseonensis TaxID=2791027 RepID=A0ABS0IIB2_9BACT|nr:glycosyltransferase [Hymenobacter jeongseonensis]MBF9238090.1 glycosyltransferase [Hymenobacter jeongseonensis]
MTAPNFSVLLLAWDDADPSVAVLGGSALPPTLPLVYQLATQHPVLAVYPTLPASEAAAGQAPEKQPDTAAPTSAAVAESEARPTEPLDVLTTTEATPGLRRLPGPGFASTAAATEPAFGSRIIGLNDLASNSAAALPMPLADAPEDAKAQARALAHNQWPTGLGARELPQWAAPAAPYIGASTEAALLPHMPQNPTPGTFQTVREAADLLSGAGITPAAATSAAGTALRSRATAQAGDLSFDPDPELPTVMHLAPFGEGMTEPGTSEAAALLAPEDDITLAAPQDSAPSAPPEEKLPAASASPAPVPLLLMPVLDGLNFRIIQYARRAAQLVRGRSDFGVIYAPNWPAWLAALEIRNSTGQPLVLYIASMATDIAGPAERGWLLEMERMTLRRAHVILVPNEDLRQRLDAEYGGAIGEVRVVAAADEATVQRVLSEVAQG